MKKLIYLVIIILAFCSTTIAQNSTQHSPQGFDTLQAGITHSKSDTFSHTSKSACAHHPADLARPKFHSDNSNGTYTNPVISADYPDPDVILVDDVYYFVSTTILRFSEIIPPIQDLESLPKFSIFCLSSLVIL